MEPTAMAKGNAGAGRIVTFQYPACPGDPAAPSWTGWGEEEPAADGQAERARAAAGASEAALRAEFEQRVVAETRRAFEAGRERGRQEGRQAEQEAQAGAQAAAEQRRARQGAELIAGFAQERERYLHAVEREVVDLALAVAARILRREAQMDPLLLTGAVRVALGQLSGSTQVRLEVPPGELELWTEAIALLPGLAHKPAVLPGEGMRLGDCRIETALGSVDLGIRAQLSEIERGFFDRAGSRATEPVLAASVPGERG
jgi:flagellar assembly protein FliH